MADENDNININVGINPAAAESGGRRARSAVKGVSDEAAQLQSMYKRMQSAIDPAYAAQEKYNRSLEEHRRLLAAGVISGQEFAAANRAAAQSLNDSRTAVERNSAAYREAMAQKKAASLQEAADAKTAANAVKVAEAEKAAAARTAAAAQAEAARMAAREEREAARITAQEVKAAARQKAADERNANREIADAATASRRAEKAAVREAAQATKQAAAEKREADRSATAAAREAAEAVRRQAIESRSLARTEQELRASIDPVYAAQTRYNQTMATATQLLMGNKLQQGEWIRIQKQAQIQMDINTRSLGRQNTGYVQIGYQMQDVVASFASGINPMVILAQQGGQTAAAVSQMGGKFAGVASFFAGPWGAALFGAVTVLGLLIPQLFSAASASDAMARSQENLKNYVDSATGSIYAQVTATQRLAAAKSEADQAEKTRTTQKAGIKKVTNVLAQSTTDLNTGIIGDGGIRLPAEIQNPRSAALINKWVQAVREGRLPVENLAIGLRNLGRQDPAVAKVYGRVQQQIAVTQDADMAARKFDATQRVFLGTATAADKKMLGMAASTKALSEGYLNAQATLRTSTDGVTAARARQTIAEEDAQRVRTAAIAKGVPDAQANETYIKTVAPFISATTSAENARSAASKAASAGRAQARKEESEARRAAIEEMRWKIETFEYEKEAAQDSYSEQVRIQQAKVEALRGFYGEQSKEVVRAQRELQSMERRHAQELLQIERERIATQANMRTAEIERDRSAASVGRDQGNDNLDAMQNLGMIDGRPLIEARRTILEEQYRMEVEFENRIYELKLKSMRDQLALLPPQSSARASMNMQIEEFEATHQNILAGMAVQQARDINKINLDVIQNTASKWRVVTDSVAQSFGQMFQGIWMHTGNFKQDLLNVADQLVFKFADAGLKMASDWAANELSKTAASILGLGRRTAIEATAEGGKTAAKAAGATARAGIVAAETATEMGATAATTGAAVTAEAVKTGAKVAGAATDTALTVSSATTEIGARAATSAAGAYSSTVIIPFIGPVAAPAAAALALAAVMGFGALISAKGGMGEVPDDQLAMVHKKEMILPAWIAEPMRKSLRSPSSSGVMGQAALSGADARAATHMPGGGDTIFKYMPTHTNMGAGFDELLRRDGSSLRKWIRNQVRNGALKV